jgi:uncharacterized protein (TIGR02246 family)
MENTNGASNKTSNETQIRQLIEKWAAAVRNKDFDGILANHSNDIVMYDVPEPFQSIGIDAYRKTWDTFYSGTSLGAFDILTLQVISDEKVAFCFATMKCLNRERNGAYEPLDFRLTVGLKKLDDQWTIVHEHHSVPAD